MLLVVLVTVKYMNYQQPEWNPKIPARYENVVYDDVSKEIQELFEKIKTTRKGIYIHGAVGTGKTHVAYALYKYCMQKSGVRGRFWNTTELLRDIRLDYDRDAFSKHRTEQDLMVLQSILFLDDIGAEKNSDWATETFYMIINRRYNDRLPMIFTSNLSVGQLSTHLDDRTASRIAETCDIVELKGKDRRL